MHAIGALLAFHLFLFLIFLGVLALLLHGVSTGISTFGGLEGFLLSG